MQDEKFSVNVTELDKKNEKYLDSKKKNISPEWWA